MSGKVSISFPSHQRGEPGGEDGDLQRAQGLPGGSTNIVHEAVDATSNSSAKSTGLHSSSFNSLRAASACDRCRKRKSKCSGTSPCTHCAKHKLPCTFTYVKKIRTNFKKSSKLQRPEGANGGTASNGPGAGSGIVGTVGAASNKSKSPLLVSRSEAARGAGGTDKAIGDDTSQVRGTLLRILEVTEALWEKMSNLDSKMDGLNDRLSAMEKCSHSGGSSLDGGGSSGINSGGENACESNFGSNITTRGGSVTHERFSANKETSDKTKKEHANVHFPAERFMELVSSLCSHSIFSSETLNFIKAKTGKNYEIFKPAVDSHVYFLKQLAHTIKFDFNNLSNFNDYLLTKPQTVKYFIKMFLKLHIKAFLITDDEAFSLCYRFYGEYIRDADSPGSAKSNKEYSKRPNEKTYKHQKLTDSEMLIFSAMICIGCTYVNSKLHGVTLSRTPKRPSKLDLEEKIIISTPRTLLVEVEWNTMKNCFYYFLKIQSKNEGKSTLVGIILLFLYLNSTIYSKFNYFILNAAFKHARILGYDKLAADYDNNDYGTTDEEFWQKKLMWVKLYMFDLDISTAVEKPAHVKDQRTIHEVGFIKLARFYIYKHCKKHGWSINKEIMMIDNDLEFDKKGALINSAKFFEILHNFAQYDSTGFIILVYYYAFCVFKLISCFSRENYLSNILKIVTGMKDRDSSQMKDDFLTKLYDSLGQINNLSKQFEEWEKSVPENIRPGNNLDISMYQYNNPDNEVDPEVEYLKKRNIREPLKYQKNDLSDAEVFHGPVRLRFSGFDVHELDGSEELSASLLIICSFKYNFHLMKSYRFAFQASKRIYKDEQLLESIAKAGNVEPKKLSESLRSRAETYNKMCLGAARDIQRLSVTSFKSHHHAIYWYISYINFSYFTLFMEQITDYSNRDQEEVLKQKLEDIHLMLDCYNKCFSKSYFPTERVKLGVKDIFNRRLLMLCITNLKEKFSYNIDYDDKIQEFYKSVEETKDEENWATDPANYEASKSFNNRKRPAPPIKTPLGHQSKRKASSFNQPITPNNNAIPTFFNTNLKSRSPSLSTFLASDAICGHGQGNAPEAILATATSFGSNTINNIAKKGSVFGGDNLISQLTDGFNRQSGWARNGPIKPHTSDVRSESGSGNQLASVVALSNSELNTQGTNSGQDFPALTPPYGNNSSNATGSSFAANLGNFANSLAIDFRNFDSNLSLPTLEQTFFTLSKDSSGFFPGMTSNANNNNPTAPNASTAAKNYNGLGNAASGPTSMTPTSNSTNVNTNTNENMIRGSSNYQHSNIIETDTFNNNTNTNTSTNKSNDAAAPIQLLFSASINHATADMIRAQSDSDDIITANLVGEESQGNYGFFPNLRKGTTSEDLFLGFVNPNGNGNISGGASSGPNPDELMLNLLELDPLSMGGYLI